MKKKLVPSFILWLVFLAVNIMSIVRGIENNDHVRTWLSCGSMVIMFTLLYLIVKQFNKQPKQY